MARLVAAPNKKGSQRLPHQKLFPTKKCTSGGGLRQENNDSLVLGFSEAAREIIYLKGTKSKLAKEREGAYRIAGLICDELEKLPKEEQRARIKAIQAIKVADRRM